MNVIRRTWTIFMIIALALPSIAFALVYLYEDRFADLPYFKAQNMLETGGPHYTVPDFEFTNQDGMSVTQTFVSGKIWVGHYFFTSCPSICPRMIAGLRDVDTYFSDDSDIRLLSFTVDPERDDAQRLKAYCSTQKISTNKWQFLTGDKKSLYRFARKGLLVDVTDGNGGPGDFIHSDKLVLIDRQDHIRGFYNGTDKADIGKLIKDIKRLK